MNVSLTPTLYAMLGCVAAVGNVVLFFVLMLAGRRIYRSNRKNSDVAILEDGQESPLLRLLNFGNDAWKWRSTAVVLSVGLISFGQVYHDSVVDNLLPAVEPWLLQNYGSVAAGKQS